MLFLLSCLYLLLQDKYSAVWPQSVSERWEKKYGKAKRKLKGNMSVTSEAENQAGDGSNISVSQREFCWFTAAAALTWQGGEGEPGQTLEWGGGQWATWASLVWPDFWGSWHLALIIRPSQVNQAETSCSWNMYKNWSLWEMLPSSINTLAVIIEVQEESVALHASMGRQCIWLLIKGNSTFWQMSAGRTSCSSFKHGYLCYRTPLPWDRERIRDKNGTCSACALSFSVKPAGCGELPVSGVAQMWQRQNVPGAAVALATGWVIEWSTVGGVLEGHLWNLLVLPSLMRPLLENIWTLKSFKAALFG